MQKRDIDTNGHLNNIIYLDLAMEGFEDEFCDSIKSVEIYYKAECKLGEEIVFMKNSDNSVYVLDKEKQKLHTLIKLKGEENENR